MNSDGLIPCSPEEAVTRLLSVEDNGGMYILGTGAYQALAPSKPWTHGQYLDSLGQRVDGWGSDCAGAAISFAYRLRRHRPGFNSQPRATVSDDLNVDSIVEDADPARGGRQELGELVAVPQPGDLLITPTIRLPAQKFTMMGHVRLVLDVSRWRTAAPRWADVIYLECRGPNGHRPGVTRNTGEGVDQHDKVWPKPLHRAALVRIRARP